MQGLAALPALAGLLLATALTTLVLLIRFLATLWLLIGLHSAALLLPRTGVVLLARILIGIVGIGHSHLLEFLGDAPVPRGKRPEMKRVRSDNDEFAALFPDLDANCTEFAAWNTLANWGFFLRMLDVLVCAIVIHEPRPARAQSHHFDGAQKDH